MSVALLYSDPYHGEPLTGRRLFPWCKDEMLTYSDELAFCQNFIKEHTKGFPRYIQRRLTKAFIKYFELGRENGDKRPAFDGLVRAAKPYKDILATSPFNNNYALVSAKLIDGEAQVFADKCTKLIAENTFQGSYNNRIYHVTELCIEFVESRHIESPLKEETTAARESALLRMQDEKWWARKLHKARDQINEYFAITARLIGKGKNEYCSDVCAREYAAQQKANWAYLASMELVDEETNEAFNLKEVAERTAANPDNRRVELFVRVRGLEELANELGYSAIFVTMTAPSKYHRASRNWNGSKPNETQSYLNSVWKKARAKIGRDNLDWFGIRVSEPHADATPHWHMLIFCKREHERALRANIRRYAVECDKQELIDAHKKRRKSKVSKDHKDYVKYWYSPRFDVEQIDPAKGSAVGYISKYISKNINGKNVESESDFDGTGTLKDAAGRVVAWAARWRIRQFQFFGAERISIWREFRRIKSPLEDSTFEKIRLAADSSNWAEFSRLCEPHDIKFSDEDNGTNEYNEAVSRVTGLLINGFELLTRTARFFVRKVGAADKGATRAASWSTVNNCTGINEGGSSTGTGIDSKNSISFRDNVKNALDRLGLDTSFTDILLNGGKIHSGKRGYQIIDGCLREHTPKFVGGL